MSLSRAAFSAFFLKLALAGAALLGLGQVVAWGAIADAAAAADAAWAGAALALLPVNVGLETYRFHRLLRRSVERPPSFLAVASAVIGAYPMGLLTPGRVGDYAGRALYLRDVPVSTTAALTFSERTATLACCLLFGVAALPFWIARPSVHPGWALVLPIGALGAAALITLVLHPRIAERVLGAALPFRRLAPAVAALGAVPRREARVLLALSAVRYAVFTTQFLLLVRAFAPDAAWAAADWAAAAGGVALVFFAKSAVPGVTLGDLGVREGAAVYFLAWVGGAAAFNASLGLFAVNLLLPALAGLPLVARLRVGAASAIAADMPARVAAARRPASP